MRRFVCPLAMVVAFAFLIGCDTPAVEFGDPTLNVIDKEVGLGRSAKRGDIVTINYVMSLPSGETVLEDSGYRFELGAGAVIECIDRVVDGMRRGGRRVAVCPPSSHWGRQGYAEGKIPPNTSLTVDVELVGAR